MCLRYTFNDGFKHNTLQKKTAMKKTYVKNCYNLTYVVSLNSSVSLFITQYFLKNIKKWKNQMIISNKKSWKPHLKTIWTTKTPQKVEYIVKIAKFNSLSNKRLLLFHNHHHMWRKKQLCLHLDNRQLIQVGNWH